MTTLGSENTQGLEVPKKSTLKIINLKPAEVKKDNTQKLETTKLEPMKLETTKLEPMKLEPMKVEPKKLEPMKVDLKVNKKSNMKVKESVDSEEDLSNHSDDSSDEPEDGFYVELSLTCVDEDGETEDHHVIFNFDDEDSYMEHSETGYEDLEEHFENAIAEHFPGYEYTGEWEEYHMHGNELPEDIDSPIISIDY